MRKKIWRTQHGLEIPYRKLEDGHLLNILRWIKRIAYSGILVNSGACFIDIDESWHTEQYIEGDEVKELYDYDGLLAEAKRRKLVPKGTK